MFGLSDFKSSKDVVRHILRRCAGQAELLGDAEFGRKLLSRERRDAAGESRREIHAAEKAITVEASNGKAKARWRVPLHGERLIWPLWSPAVSRTYRNRQQGC